MRKLNSYGYMDLPVLHSQQIIDRAHIYQINHNNVIIHKQTTYCYFCIIPEINIAFLLYAILFLWKAYA